MAMATASGRLDRAAAVMWARKWWYYQPYRLPWRRAALHVELARRQCFARGPMNGDVLAMLREGRLTLGPHCYFEPGVWLTGIGRILVGEGVFMNLNVMVAAKELVEIGDHCMIANGCLITDSNHRYDNLDVPIAWQGYESKGPTRLGDNVWMGVNSVVLSGVTIGRHCVIGANSVVTRDVPDYSIAVGTPARVIGKVTG